MKGRARKIGSTKQLFVDDYVIDEMDNVSKTFNQAEKHPDNPLIRSDRPWEKIKPGEGVMLYGTVLYDENEKIFKMWYRGDLQTVSMLFPAMV